MHLIHAATKAKLVLGKVYPLLPGGKAEIKEVRVDEVHEPSEKYPGGELICNRDKGAWINFSPSVIGAVFIDARLEAWYKSAGPTVSGYIFDDSKGHFADNTLVHEPRIMEEFEVCGTKFVKTPDSIYLLGVQHDDFNRGLIDSTGKDRQLPGPDSGSPGEHLSDGSNKQS